MFGVYVPLVRELFLNGLLSAIVHIIHGSGISPIANEAGTPESRLDSLKPLALCHNYSSAIRPVL